MLSLEELNIFDNLMVSIIIIDKITVVCSHDDSEHFKILH